MDYLSISNSKLPQYFTTCTDEERKTILQSISRNFDLFNSIWELAVMEGNLALIRFIIDCPIDYPYPTSFNIIHYANRNGIKKVVNYLLQTENYTPIQKSSLLHRAIKGYRVAGTGIYLIKELIKQGVVIDESSIMFYLEPALGLHPRDSKIIWYYQYRSFVDITLKNEYSIRFMQQ